MTAAAARSEVKAKKSKAAVNASSTFDLYFDVTLALAKEKKATSLYRAPSEGNQKEGRIRSASSKKQLLVVDLCTTLHNDSPFFPQISVFSVICEGLPQECGLNHDFTIQRFVSSSHLHGKYN